MISHSQPCNVFNQFNCALSVHANDGLLAPKISCVRMRAPSYDTQNVLILQTLRTHNHTSSALDSWFCFSSKASFCSTTEHGDLCLIYLMRHWILASDIPPNITSKTPTTKQCFCSIFLNFPSHQPVLLSLIATTTQRAEYKYSWRESARQ